MNWFLSTMTIVSTVFFSTIGCSSSETSGSCDNSSMDGYQTVTVDGETREYILELPDNYDSASTEPLPLILNFHGNGGCADNFSQGREDGPSGLSDIVNNHNVIVAYPQGVVRVKGAAEWDPGDNGTSSIIDNDVYFGQQLIADIAANHSIDLARVYATGYSNGGMMAYGLACELGGEIAAAGIMSGILLGTCAQDYITPIIHFHGTADDALPYEGNQEYASVSEVISFWVAHNEIPEEGLTTTLNNGLVTQDVYSGGAEDSSVVLYTTLGGGHVWFGEDIDGQSPNDILWDFLSGYHINGRIQ